MRSEADKWESELRAFVDFLQLIGEALVGEARKGDAARSEPDVLCELKRMGPVAFELTKACVPEFERAFSRAGREPVQCTWGGDTIDETYTSKIGKKYRTDRPIHLLFYEEQSIALPFGIIRDKLTYRVGMSGLGPFAGVWLSADGCACRVPS
jgi:hypothetical protein